MPKSDDLASIIAGCQQGKNESFSRLIDMYGRRCYGYFYRMTGNRDVSDDLLSELFVRLVEKINTYRGGVFDSWLFRVASNIFFDYLRRKRRQDKLLDAKRSEIDSEVNEEQGAGDERADQLQVQLEKLDDDTRSLIMLRFYSQLSFREIAKIRSEPIGTTLSKLHRGLSRLRELME